MRANRLVALALTGGTALVTGVMAPAVANADTGTPAPTASSSPTDTPSSSPTDTPSSPPTSAPGACRLALPGYVEGKPAGVHAQGAAGDYLWHDKDGWHLRVTHKGKRRVVFTGVVSATDPIHFRKVADEKRDKVAVSKNGKQLAFRLVNFGGIDGFDFRDDCAKAMRLDLRADGHRLTPNQVYIGAHSARPRGNPFTIVRRGPAQPAPTPAPTGGTGSDTDTATIGG